MSPAFRRLVVVVCFMAAGPLFACGRPAPRGAGEVRALVVPGVPAPVASALTWLGTQQNGDGSYGDRPSSLATPPQSTAEVVRGQIAWAGAADPEVARAIAYLDAQVDVATELQASRIVVDAAAGRRRPELVAALLANRNADGGFGDRPGFASSARDTALALEALGAAGITPGAETAGAVAFLRARQLAGGGWSDGDNEPSIDLTARALLALAAHRSVHAGAAEAASRAEAFLLSRRDGQGLWGEDFTSASALLALVSSVADLAVLVPSEVALRGRQDPDGSWVQDSYTTGLVLQVLRAYEARRTGPGSTAGAISGHVVRAGSTEPIAGATVSIDQLPGAAITSNGEGYFLLSGLPAGAYTVTAGKAGHSSAGTSVVVQAGKVTVAGDLVLQVLGDKGLVRGLVFDAATREGLSGVQVTLGAAGRSVLSNAAGEFDFGPVAPGDHAIAFAKAGYLTLAGTVTVVAGQTLVAQLGLTRDGGFQDPGPGTVQGRVVDGDSGQALAGAVVDLGGGKSGASGAGGAFAIEAVPRGTYQGTVRAPGYQGVTFTMIFTPGASGDLGTIALYPSQQVEPPTSLRLRGEVVDGVSGAPVGGAAVTVSETGASATTGADGKFEIAGIAVKSFTLAVDATGYAPASYGIQVAAFGEATVSLKLSPPGTGAGSTTLAGVVTSAVTGAPVAGAQLAVAGTPHVTTTGADGSYRLEGIAELELTVNVSAVGFAALTSPIRLASHGSFTLNPALQPVPADSFQVVALDAEPGPWGANAQALFRARVASLLGADKTVLIIGDVHDASGARVASVTPFAEGTATPATSFTFTAGETKALTVPWNTAQFPPGRYRLILRVIEPGTVTRAMPHGEVLAENAASTNVVPSEAIEGALSLSPPLTQAGLPTPVSFAALVRNAGNVPLAATTLVLKVAHPDTGADLFVAEAAAPALAVGANAPVELGTWVPTVAGNLPVKVQPKTASVAGLLVDRLYVGDKAAGSFAVDREVVPEGTQTVRGRIDLQGVDVSRGSSTDPLFALVKEAVRRGGVYTAPNAVSWHNSGRCLGCHIQTQSLLGLSSALEKAEIDRPATDFLFNAISSSQQGDGALRISHPEFARTQTILGLWSLEAWPDPRATFRTKYLAAKHVLGWKVRSGDTTRWNPDHATGWWNTDVSHTALAIKAFADVVDQAARLDLAQVPDYSLAARFAAGGRIADLAAGPGGKLYVARVDGNITAIDPVTGAVTPVATVSPANLLGMAVADDGTVYVARSSAPTLVKIPPGGPQEGISVPTGTPRHLALGPGGWLYFCDAGAVRRRSPAGAFELVASGGRLSTPNGLGFDADGNLLVANGNGYNILKVAPDRAVSVFADGLAYRPRRLSVAGGELFVTTENGLTRVRADGTAESAATNPALTTVATIAGQTFVGSDSGNAVLGLQVGSMAAPDVSTSVAAFKAEIPFAARFLLAGHRDNSTDNIVQALRLIGLAEAVPALEDAGLRAQAAAAVTFIDGLLRSRQRPDGGWTRYQGGGSDPLVTAMVGIALEYGEPSADDPLIRKTIQHLLNTQRADGSWDNVNNGLSTRLASTSFVMIFMPKALERLGGIDIDLELELAANVVASNPTVPATSTQPAGGGGTLYRWELKGVTGAGRTLELDLTLQDMDLGEVRPVARAASLSFANSFVNERIRLPLAVPSVRTAAALALAVRTDRATYLANERVQLLSAVRNLGPTAAAGDVRLAVRPVGQTTATAEIAPLPFADLAPGAESALGGEWNTGNTLVGSYELYGRLFDARGRLVAEKTAPFQIVAPPGLAATAVTTDRPIYESFDTVQITGRVRNTAPNAFLPPTLVELVVESPAGATILSETRSLPQLGPLAVVDLPVSKALADAPSGMYPVSLVLKDQFTRVVLSTSSTLFEVRGHTAQGLAGAVTVDATQVARGAGNRCHERVTNVASAAVAGLRVVHRLTSVTTGATLDEVSETVTLAGGQAHDYLRAIDTRPLAAGEYACLLLAETGGVTRVLASAGFMVVEPPVAVGARMEAGKQGRLLVLLDRGGSGSRDADPFGPSSAPGLGAQLAFLKELLARRGWSYTITDDAASFTRELRTGGYFAYALLSEKEKLAEQVQQELREAVFRGEGLLVAGDHDSRNQKVHHALGVKYLGLERATVVTPRNAGAPIPGPLALLVKEDPLRVRRQGAESLAVYGADLRRTGCDPDAVTFYSYGRGRAVSVGPDLLALAARDGQASAAATALGNLLGLVRPAEVALAPGAVVPVQVTVTNQGVAAPATVSVPLPAGTRLVDAGGGQVSGQTVSFAFPLAVDEVKTVQLWLRLPLAAGDVALTARVTAGVPPTQVTVVTGVTVTTRAPEALSALRAKLDQLASAFPRHKTALRQASDAVGKAIGNVPRDQAVKQVLKATDLLLGLQELPIVDVRAALGAWLRATFASAG